MNKHQRKHVYTMLLAALRKDDELDTAEQLVAYMAKDLDRSDWIGDENHWIFNLAIEALTESMQ